MYGDIYNNTMNIIKTEQKSHLKTEETEKLNFDPQIKFNVDILDKKNILIKVYLTDILAL